MIRVSIQPEMRAWARERGGFEDVGALTDRFPRLPDWEAGDSQPTLKQVERFARAVLIPVGYLFLSSPPEEPLPIPCRTMEGRGVRRPSPDLLDTIYACQERQEWYRDYTLAARTRGDVRGARQPGWATCAPLVDLRDNLMVAEAPNVYVPGAHLLRLPALEPR